MFSSKKLYLYSSKSQNFQKNFLQFLKITKNLATPLPPIAESYTWHVAIEGKKLPKSQISIKITGIFLNFARDLARLGVFLSQGRAESRAKKNL